MAEMHQVEFGMAIGIHELIEDLSGMPVETHQKEKALRRRRRTSRIREDNRLLSINHGR